jgi:hypothetical protein
VVFIYATMCSIQSCYKALRNNSWDARISDVVTLLRSVDGPIKFKCIGFEFEGAAGQIVMFVLVFLSFVLSISLLGDA